MRDIGLLKGANDCLLLIGVETVGELVTPPCSCSVRKDWWEGKGSVPEIGNPPPIPNGAIDWALQLLPHPAHSID